MRTTVDAGLAAGRIRAALVRDDDYATVGKPPATGTTRRPATPDTYLTPGVRRGTTTSTSTRVGTTSSVSTLEGISIAIGIDAGGGDERHGQAPTSRLGG
ncbi:MAG: hypothetical protein ABSF89_15865 [Acidimicrobiales bacterium]